MLPLFKLLNFNHHAIQQQCAQLALDMDLVHSTQYEVNTDIDLTTLYNEVPTIQNFLTTYNLTVNRASFTTLRELSSTEIYSQDNGFPARIEIPVLGCAYSSTVFYRAAKTVLRRMDSGIDYWGYDSASARELDRVTLMQPTVINSKIPQQIIVTRRNVRRISLRLDVGAGAYPLLTATSQ